MSRSPRFPRRLEESLRTAGLVCGILIWSTYGFMMWTPTVLDRAGSVKGWDFSQFYVLGHLAAAGRPEALSDSHSLGERATAFVSPTFQHSTIMPVYGPQIALLFAPLAHWSYSAALAAWLIVSLALYAVCCIALWRACPDLAKQRVTTAILAAGSPALFFLICYGQLSAVALACVTAGFCALRRGRRVLAGLALGTLIYKPQLAVAIAVVFLCAREWRMIAGGVAAVAAQLGLAWAYAGTAAIRAYLDTLIHLNVVLPLIEEKRYLLQSLRSFFDLILPWPSAALAAYLLASVGVLLWTWRIWQSEAPLSLRYSLLLFATVLVSPHFYVYDLLILTPVWFLLADWLIRRPDAESWMPIALCLALLYFVPLGGVVVARTWHVQPSVILLIVLIILISRHAVAAERPSASYQVAKAL